MKTYEVPYISSQPNWESIPVAPIDTYLWSDVRTILPSAQAAWSEDALYVRLQAIEPHIRREYTGDWDPVCEDSCLEFFFCPKSGDQRYFNFEGNPNGSLYVGFGNPGGDRCRLHHKNWKTLLQVTPFEIPGGWGWEFRIPVSFIRIFVPEFKLHSGLTLQANFFKCGDKTDKAHYMSWNPVEHPSPCFHLPQFFGQLKLI